MATRVAMQDGPLDASRMRSRGPFAIVAEVLFGAGTEGPLVQHMRRHDLACHMSVASRRRRDWWRDRGVRDSAVSPGWEASILMVGDSTAGVMCLLRYLNDAQQYCIMKVASCRGHGLSKMLFAECATSIISPMRHREGPHTHSWSTSGRYSYEAPRGHLQAWRSRAALSPSETVAC